MPTATPWLVRVLDSNWRDDTNYAAGDLKFHNEKYWKALQPSGPDKGGAKEPGVDADAWEAADSDVVPATGDTEIGGIKTFTQKSVRLQNNDYTMGTDPSGNAYWNIVIRDAEDNSLGDILFWHNTDANDGNTGFELRILNHDGQDISADIPKLGIVYDNDRQVSRTISTCTTDNPADNELVTVDYLKKFTASQLPLYFTADSLELHTFVPANAKTVRYAALEADGSGTSGLTLTMARDIGSTDSMSVTGTATDCSAYANHSVTFTLGGVSDQTEIAAMVVFE